MAKEIVTLKVSELVEDYNLYPRHRVDEYHGREIADAIEAGQSMPAIVADKASKRIIDGFHRVYAYRRLYGPDAVAKVELRPYKSEADMFADAMLLNAAHGRNLTTYDKARCLVLGEKLGLTRERIAEALHMTRSRADEIVQDRVSADGVELKSTMQHLAGKKLTDEAKDFNRSRAGGMSQLFYINQVIAMLEAGVVDLEREKVREALKKLADLLDKVLVVSV